MTAPFRIVNDVSGLTLRLECNGHHVLTIVRGPVRNGAAEGELNGHEIAKCLNELGPAVRVMMFMMGWDKEKVFEMRLSRTDAMQTEPWSHDLLDFLGRRGA